MGVFLIIFLDILGINILEFLNSYLVHDKKKVASYKMIKWAQGKINVYWYAIVSLSFFKKWSLMIYHLHTIKFINFKCIIPQVLTNVYSHVTILQERYRIFLSPPKRTLISLCCQSSLHSLATMNLFSGTVIMSFLEFPINEFTLYSLLRLAYVTMLLSIIVCINCFLYISFLHVSSTCWL